MSTFKFKVRDNKVWDGLSLKRALVRDFPGAKNALEAMAIAKQKRIDNPPEDVGFEMTKAIIEIENYGAGKIAIAPEHEKKLSEMPTETVPQIQLWVKAWKRAIDLAKTSP